MHKRILVWLTVIVLGGLFLPATIVTAASEQPNDGVVIWNEDYTLTEDEELNGDLVVFNGDVALESGSMVRGNVVVWNGNAQVDGTVEGDLVASNGDIQLTESARVQGDVVCTWNCKIERPEGARIDGDIVEGPSLRGLPFIPWGEPRLTVKTPRAGSEPFWVSGPEELLRWMFRTVRRAVTVLVIAAIGGLVALIWPDATAQVGRTVFQSPGTSVGVGFLTLVAAVALILALTITICLSPAAALVALALSAAGLLGWIAIGARIGERLLRAVNAGAVAPMWTAAVGTLIMTLITMGLSMAFCLSPLGWLLTFVIGCFGLGAVVLTRFGTTSYVPGQGRKVAAPTPPPAALEEPTQPVSEEEDIGAASEEDQSV